MPQLMLYNGGILTVGGALATSLNCCCSCPIGDLAVFAYYFTDADQVEVGVDELTYVNEVLSEFNGTFFGYDLRVAFWIGNPTGDGTYYGEFQIWLVAECCPKETTCDDFYYQDKAESFANSWSRITDPSTQFEWEPPWDTGSCAGLTIQNDAGIDILFDCAKETISFPSDPATGAFVKRESIEICCG